MIFWVCLAVWILIGRSLIWLYRREYHNKYPFLRELQELEDKEVNEFRAEVYPIIRCAADFAVILITGLLWPLDIYMYRRWANKRI